jgi:hypothetical protein
MAAMAGSGAAAGSVAYGVSWQWWRIRRGGDVSIEKGEKSVKISHRAIFECYRHPSDDGKCGVGDNHVAACAALHGGGSLSNMAADSNWRRQLAAAFFIALRCFYALRRKAPIIMAAHFTPPPQLERRQTEMGVVVAWRRIAERAGCMASLISWWRQTSKSADIHEGRCDGMAALAEGNDVGRAYRRRCLPVAAALARFAIERKNEDGICIAGTAACPSSTVAIVSAAGAAPRISRENDWRGGNIDHRHHSGSIIINISQQRRYGNLRFGALRLAAKGGTPRRLHRTAHHCTQRADGFGPSPA